MRLSILADFREEAWPSMDLVAEMLVSELQRMPDIACAMVRPRMWRLPSERAALRPPAAAERFVARFIQYPASLANIRRSADVFHIADHSYAHLVCGLPARRTGVYCHDIDAFRPLFPQSGKGGLLRRAMAKLTLSGMRRAAVVFYSTEAIRNELLEQRLVASERLVHAPYGIAQEFRPESDEHDGIMRARFGRYLLHVGSCIARKNTEFLLRVFAKVRAQSPSLSLVQVGGTWTAEGQALLHEYGVLDSVHQLRGLSRVELAAIYRQAAAVLLPSTAEGFGLPVIESLACGAPVVASDLPVLREVGGDAVVYCVVGDLQEWSSVVLDVLASDVFALRKIRLARAAHYSWRLHTGIIVEQYRRLTREVIGERSIQ